MNEEQELEWMLKSSNELYRQEKYLDAANSFMQAIKFELESSNRTSVIIKILHSAEKSYLDAEEYQLAIKTNETLLTLFDEEEHHSEIVITKVQQIQLNWLVKSYQEENIDYSNDITFLIKLKKELTDLSHFDWQVKMSRYIIYAYIQLKSYEVALKEIDKAFLEAKKTNKAIHFAWLYEYKYQCEEAIGSYVFAIECAYHAHNYYLKEFDESAAEKCKKSWLRLMDKQYQNKSIIMALLFEFKTSDFKSLSFYFDEGHVSKKTISKEQIRDTMNELETSPDPVKVHRVDFTY